MSDNLEAPKIDFQKNVDDAIERQLKVGDINQEDVKRLNKL